MFPVELGVVAVVVVAGEPNIGCAGRVPDFKVNAAVSLGFSSTLLTGVVVTVGVVGKPKPKVNLGAAGASVLGTCGALGFGAVHAAHTALSFLLSV